MHSSREFVTVVSGVPRSGTSLVMQMLGAGGMPLLSDARRAPDVHNPRGYFEYAPVKALRRDASWLEQAIGRAVKVVLPLASELPPGRAYRVVLLRRNLHEVLRSQEAMLAETAPPAPELPAARWIGIFEAQLVEFEAWAAATPGVELLPLEHAALLRDPRGAALALADFLGGGLDVEAMAGAVDPALHRSRAPASRRPAPPG